jgi:hypothetical protein
LHARKEAGRREKKEKKYHPKSAKKKEAMRARSGRAVEPVSAPAACA